MAAQAKLPGLLHYIKKIKKSTEPYEKTGSFPHISGWNHVALLRIKKNTKMLIENGLKMCIVPSKIYLNRSFFQKTERWELVMRDDRTGLLFYHSCENFTADFARGQAEPTFCDKVDVIDDGAVGKAFQCDNIQKLAFRAPHNIYAERGTLSFFWRSRYPVGPTEFPIFRVGYADHSSWDACWLRIDYNGSGFDAMITDINLSRARVSVKMDPFPAPETWTHLALSWDENFGIRFYVNGVLAAEEYRPAVYFAGLDQFGPHSRIISNWNVISDYNYIRGGDIDEIAIYDRMLDESQILTLSKGELVENLPPYRPDMSDKKVADGWNLRSGFAPVAPCGDSGSGCCP